MKSLTVTLALLLGISLYAVPQEVSVISVIDGNTIEVELDDNQTYIILLVNIDAPEIDQEFGIEARDYLEKIALKKNITVEMAGKDRHGNRLATITLRNGTNIGDELLKAGFAWNRNESDTESVSLQEYAMNNQIGLWSSDDPTPPWIYKRVMSMKGPKSL